MILKYYLLITAIICSIGAIDMMSYGAFGIYEMWTLSAMWIGVYFGFQKK